MTRSSTLILFIAACSGSAPEAAPSADASTGGPDVFPSTGDEPGSSSESAGDDSTAFTEESSGGDAASTTGDVPDCVVPVSHPTIQAAIDDVGCPTVEIQAGEYAENLVIGAAKTLIGDGEVVIDGGGVDRVVRVVGGAVELRDLALTGGWAPTGAGIEHSGPEVLTLRGVEITDNVAEAPGAAGAGIHTVGTVVVEASDVHGNTCRSNLGHPLGGAGIAIEDGSLTLTDGTTVRDNVVLSTSIDPLAVPLSGGGIRAADADVVLDGGAEVSGNTIQAGELHGVAHGGGIAITAGTLAVRGAAVIADNQLEVSGCPMCGTRLKGGGVHASGTAVDLEGDTVVAGNLIELEDALEAVGGGLSLEDGATLWAERVGIRDNAVDGAGLGGGVWLRGLPEATFLECEISSNSVLSGSGGGLHAFGIGALTVERTTVSDNSAPIGAGIVSHVDIFVSEVFTLLNSTVSSNAGEGVQAWTNVPPLMAAVGVRIDSSTITANTGSGLWLMGGAVAHNSILAGNGGPDCLGQALLHSEGAVLIEDNGCMYEGSPGDQVGMAPILGPLQDNGGPTKTHAIDEGGLAYDAGDCDGLAEDQRGQGRPAGLACDIGAFEVQ